MPIFYCQLLPLASMALVLHQLIIITTLVFALVLARVDLSTCHVLKGSLTCLDCIGHYDLSDIRVLVKCSQAKKAIMVTTKEDGTFEADLPSTTPTPPSSFNCFTKILGGQRQLYASRKDMESTTVKVPESDSYTTSSHLKFYTSCPNSSSKGEKCGAHNKGIGSSKTFDVPLPPEWGLAPSSYYFPYFFPIIGIP